MAYVRDSGALRALSGMRSATSGQRVFGGLGAASASNPPPTPSYYASPSTLRWTDGGAKALHDSLVGIDAAWTACLKVWEQIPFIDALLGAANIKKTDVEKIASLPFPIVSQLALILEGTFGQRPLDDEFRGILNNAGATMTAFSGYFGVCTALAGVFAGIAAVGGIATLGLTEAAAIPLAQIAIITSVLAAIFGAVALLCFGLAKGQIDCVALKTSVQTASTGLNAATSSDTYTVSPLATQSACQTANAADAKLDQNSPFNKALRKAKAKAKAKTAVANALAKLVGVSYATLFKAADKSPAVNTWIDAGFAAAAAGRPTPAPPSAVVAAIHGARMPSRAGASSENVDFGTDAAGTGVELEPPTFAPLGVPWWAWALGLAGGGIAVSRLRRRRA